MQLGYNRKRLCHFPFDLQQFAIEGSSNGIMPGGVTIRILVINSIRAHFHPIRLANSMCLWWLTCTHTTILSKEIAMFQRAMETMPMHRKRASGLFPLKQQHPRPCGPIPLKQRRHSKAIYNLTAVHQDRGSQNVY